jgi:stage III sporulation protein AB
MLTAADHMSCELQYRLTPLPQLCAQIQEHCKGPIGVLFGELGRELDKQILPDVSRCMEAVLSRTQDLPQSIRKILHEFGSDLGRFDLNGQLIGLDSVRTSCKANLHRLSENREARLRSYQTLGLCAGAALAILFA